MDLSKNNRIRLLNLIQHFIHLTPDDNPAMPELLDLRALLTPQKVGRKVGYKVPDKHLGCKAWPNCEDWADGCDFS